VLFGVVVGGGFNLWVVSDFVVVGFGVAFGVVVVLVVVVLGVVLVSFRFDSIVLFDVRYVICRCSLCCRYLFKNVYVMECFC
ncbi:hypothetical protein AAHH79_37385, partial [Burkholderia pseudomallei]